jgi:hypothetical protein
MVPTGKGPVRLGRKMLGVVEGEMFWVVEGKMLWVVEGEMRYRRRAGRNLMCTMLTDRF